MFTADVVNLCVLYIPQEKKGDFFPFIYISDFFKRDSVYCAVRSDTLNTGRVTSRLEISNVLLLSQRCHLLHRLSTETQ